MTSRTNRPLTNATISRRLLWPWGTAFLVAWLFITASLSARMTVDHTLPSSPLNVVMVHGILDTGRKFDTMRRVLEDAGCQCFSPSLTPNDCRFGVRDLSTKLAAQIDARFDASQPFFVIGFSMGGLIARDYVQNLADRRRVRGVFLISTPNHGTLWAFLSPNRKLRQLCNESAFLAELNADEQAWRDIPVTSYWTPFDLMILPASSSYWSVGDMKTVICPWHPLMVRHRGVIADIRSKILTLAEASPSTGQGG